MAPEVMAGIIAAIVGVFSGLITLFIGRAQIRNDRDRLEMDMRNERQRLQQDSQQLEFSLREYVNQNRVWKAEVEKLKAETEKLSIEADEMRRRRLEVERQEIRDLLLPFERAVFDAPINSEEPIQMFRAINQTRISIQKNGAALVRDQKIAEHFQSIRSILFTVETEIRDRFPDIANIADECSLESNKDIPRYEWAERSRHLLGSDYWVAVKIMMDCRNEINEHITDIKFCMRILDGRIG